MIEALAQRLVSFFKGEPVVVVGSVVTVLVDLHETLVEEAPEGAGWATLAGVAVMIVVRGLVSPKWKVR